MAYIDQAKDLLRDFKGERYLFGPGVLKQTGDKVAPLGRRAALVRDTFPDSETFVRLIQNALHQNGVSLVCEIDGAHPNAPREDLFRIADELRSANPDVIISFGGGSTIDATKSAEVLRTLGGEIDEYFGTGLVSKELQMTGKTLTPHVAIQTAASSAAHLTKYSNITDVTTGQKKLIVDEAIIPTAAIFDYAVTYSAPASLTADGALDGVSHCLEVLYGAVGKPGYGLIEQVAQTGIGIITEYLPRVMKNLQDLEARDALCLGTDMGGYAIMLGGTNGAHLTSFSFVDILSHGRACAMLNPYYTVFFAPAIERPMQVVGQLYQEAGLLDAPKGTRSSREYGEALAQAMFALAARINFPITLNEVPGFSDAHIERALTAAKDPQLKMKLENMPVPLTADMVDEYMAPILEAARTGNLNLIKNVPQA